MWLEHEPTMEEIVSAFESFDKTGISEAVFCGYGEPMVRADMVVKTAEYICPRWRGILLSPQAK